MPYRIRRYAYEYSGYGESTTERNEHTLINRDDINEINNELALLTQKIEDPAIHELEKIFI